MVLEVKAYDVSSLILNSPDKKTPNVFAILMIFLEANEANPILKPWHYSLQDNDSPGHERFARQILIDHIRHLSSSRRTASASAQNDTPPAYEDVVKPSSSSSNANGSEPSPPYRLNENGNENEDEDDDDSQPPSYIEALEQNVSQNPGGSRNAGDHVVQIELGQSDDASSLRRQAQTVWNVCAGECIVQTMNEENKRCQDGLRLGGLETVALFWLFRNMQEG